MRNARLRAGRVLALGLVLAIGGMGLSACRVSKVGARCHGNETAQDANYVLVCKSGHFRRAMTKAQGLQLLKSYLDSQAHPVRGHGGVIGDDYPAALRGAPDSTVDSWGEYNRECTSFVAWRLNSQNGVQFSDSYGGKVGGSSTWGDAGQWAARATALGIRVDSAPAVGSIAEWNANEPSPQFTAGSLGHVAWVAAVGDDGTVTIEDYNGFGGPYTYGVTSGVTAPRYIHIADF